MVPLVVGRLRIDRRRFHPPSSAGMIDAPVTVWLVDADGARFLVDSGPSDPIAAARNGHGHFSQLPHERVSARLTQQEVPLTSIDAVLYTHLHWDHAYNAALFPNARLYVQEDEYRFALDPSESQGPLYDRDVSPHYLDEVDFQLLSGDARISESLGVVWLPGHTPGSQAISVSTHAGQLLIAGDTVPLLANLASGGVVNGIAQEEGALQRSLDRLIASEADIFPSHDPLLCEWNGVNLCRVPEAVASITRDLGKSRNRNEL